MSEEDDATGQKSGVLNRREEDGNHAKHWTNKADQDVDLPLEDVDVKDEWVGVTVYLPPSLRDELELVFREHSYECKRGDMNLRKLRHFYPLIVALGLEQLDNMESEDLAPLLSYITSEYD